MRYIIHWSLRREKLCEPSGCDDAIEIRDDSGKLIRRERCADCPLDKLDEAVAHNPVLQRAIDIDFANAAGFKQTLAEVDVEEFHAIKVLRNERDKYQSEMYKESSGKK